MYTLGMEKIVVTFCGHAQISVEERRDKLKEFINKIIDDNSDKFISFYCGHKGLFDCLASRVIDEVRRERVVNCEKVFITPYFAVKDENIKDLYDDIVYPPLESVPLRFAIIRRNEWMVNEADYLISGVMFRFYRSAKTLEYAEKKFKNYGKPIIYKLCDI